MSSHQANDFQINAKFWDHLNSVTAAWNEPGRFTVLPGYEWSGNTAIGGDHNVYFATEGVQFVGVAMPYLKIKVNFQQTTTRSQNCIPLFEMKML